MPDETSKLPEAIDRLGFRIREPSGAPEGMLVLFHGRGTDENDLFPLLDELDPDGRLIGVTPRAPLNLAPGGAHWYVAERVGFPDPPTFLGTYALAGHWLDALWRRMGIPPEGTVLGGFSQGAVMSFALGLGSDRPRPAGILAMSGFIPTVPGWSIDFDRPVPSIAIGHGTADAVISVDFARQARDRLAQAGVDLTYSEYPLPHAVDPAFLAEMSVWLRETLP